MRKLFVLLIAVLAFASCSKGTPEASPTVAPTTASSKTKCTDTAPPTATPVTTQPTTKPDIKVPSGEPPCKLVSDDIYPGTGAAATASSTVTVQYTGVSWSTGQQFDSSWDRGQPATFPLSGVIPGWTQGIPGMKVGGRRELIIPPDLAYGDNPPPGSGIKPGETLIFVIDLKSVS